MHDQHLIRLPVCCHQNHVRPRPAHGAISRYLYCTAYRPCWFDALPDTWCSGGQLLGVAYTSGVTAKYSEQRSTVPHRCTDAFCPRNKGGSVGSIVGRPPRRSHGHTGRVHLVAARRVREGGPGRTARSVRRSALLGGRAWRVPQAALDAVGAAVPDVCRVLPEQISQDLRAAANQNESEPRRALPS